MAWGRAHGPYPVSATTVWGQFSVLVLALQVPPQHGDDLKLLVLISLVPPWCGDGLLVLPPRVPPQHGDRFLVLAS